MNGVSSHAGDKGAVSSPTFGRALSSPKPQSGNGSTVSPRSTQEPAHSISDTSFTSQNSHLLIDAHVHHGGVQGAPVGATMGSKMGKRYESTRSEQKKILRRLKYVLLWGKKKLKSMPRIEVVEKVVSEFIPAIEMFKVRNTRRLRKVLKKLSRYLHKEVVHTLLLQDLSFIETHFLQMHPEMIAIKMRRLYLPTMDVCARSKKGRQLEVVTKVQDFVEQEEVSAILEQYEDVDFESLFAEVDNQTTIRALRYNQVIIEAAPTLPMPVQEPIHGDSESELDTIVNQSPLLLTKKIDINYSPAYSPLTSQTGMLPSPLVNPSAVSGETLPSPFVSSNYSPYLHGIPGPNDIPPSATNNGTNMAIHTTSINTTGAPDSPTRRDLDNPFSITLYGHLPRDSNMIHLLVPDTVSEDALPTHDFSSSSEISDGSSDAEIRFGKEPSLSDGDAPIIQDVTRTFSTGSAKASMDATAPRDSIGSNSGRQLLLDPLSIRNQRGSSTVGMDVPSPRAVGGTSRRHAYSLSNPDVTIGDLLSSKSNDRVIDADEALPIMPRTDTTGTPSALTKTLRRLSSNHSGERSRLNSEVGSGDGYDAEKGFQQLLTLESETVGDSWEILLTRKVNKLSVFKKKSNDSPICVIKAFAEFEGISREVLFKTIFDVEVRAAWDKTFSDFRVADVLGEDDILYYGIKGPWGITNRDFVQRRSIRHIESEQMTIMLYKSVDTEKVPLRKGYIRANTLLSGYIIRTDPKNPNVTKLTIISQNDLKGLLPKALVNAFAGRAPLDWINAMLKGCARVMGEPLKKK
eukprot:GILK01003796.1.p1 GENE.GILK01003796.1~~GILK01003796.1.p1  ORF type:complete len:801 (+),score=136.12 GILK01003796.1:104-2506(+)